MIDESKHQKMAKEMMSSYVEYLDKRTTNVKIFKMVRDIQDSAREQGIEVENWGEFYWFLIRQRDKMKAA